MNGRSVKEILEEAWKEIKVNHNMALLSVEFRVIDLVDGDRILVDETIEAVPLVAPLVGKGD